MKLKIRAQRTAVAAAGATCSRTHRRGADWRCMRAAHYTTNETKSSIKIQFDHFFEIKKLSFTLR